MSIHAVALYAHDTVAQDAFFTAGFGLRCVDAVRLLEAIPSILSNTFTMRLLNKDDTKSLNPLRRMLSTHLSESPCFMYSSKDEVEKRLPYLENRSTHIFACYDGETPIAFIEATDDGENFVTEVVDMKNICGAYCLQEYRGTGIMQNLLNFTISTLKAEGYTRLGVDFESFNPTAYGFWLKYFTAYTHSVVRRIDEKIL